MSLFRRGLRALSALAFVTACTGDIQGPTPPSSSLARIDAARSRNTIAAGIGGAILATGGSITGTWMSSTDGYTSDVYLDSPGGDIYFGTTNQTPTGTIVSVGPVSAGEELVFYAYIRNTGFTYYSGPGSRNPDGMEHAAITDLGGGCALVGFESLFGGGDRDFDDAVFQVCQTTPPNLAPVVAAGGPYAGQEGAAVAFDASASSDPEGDALTYNWTFGDGTTVTNAGASPSHTYADNGSYTATVTVQDGHGHTSSASTEVAIANIAPTTSALADASFVAGGTYSFSGVISDPGADTFTGSVDWGDGSSAALVLSGATYAASHSYATAGAYVVAVSISDDDGGTVTRSAQVVVTEPAPPPPPPPSPTADGLVDLLGDLVSDGVISASMEGRLQASANAAAASLARGDVKAATGQLTALIKKIQAASKTGEIPAATAAALIAYVQMLLQAIA